MFPFFEKTLSLDSHHPLSENLGDRKKGSFFFVIHKGFSFFVRNKGRGRSRTAVKSFAGSCLTPGPHDHLQGRADSGNRTRAFYTTNRRSNH